MTLRFPSMACSAMVLGVFLVAGCGSTANEDEIAKAGSAQATGNAPQYKNYADFAKAQMDKNKEAADAKKKGAKASGAPATK
jgi:outer membrane murein-binding lipoprotein Lpp